MTSQSSQTVSFGFREKFSPQKIIMREISRKDINLKLPYACDTVYIHEEFKMHATPHTYYILVKN